MKNTKNLSLFLIILAGFSGCSKTVRSNVQSQLPGQADPTPFQSITVSPVPTMSLVPLPSPSASPSPSTSQTTGESIKAKYESAVLRCDLQFPLQYNYRKLGFQFQGSDSFSWDLVGNYADQKSFKLNAKTFRKDIVVNFDIKSVEMESSVVLENENGTPYKLENTPVIEGSYSYQSATPISFFRLRSSVQGNGSFTFYEGTDNSVVDEYVGSAQGNLSDEYSVVLDCTFKTKLKSSSAAE